MTPDLDRWLQRAARNLSNESTAQVRAEIQEHYGLAREAAIEGGASPDEADRVALSALGDAKIANRQYRRVLLTASEAMLLRRGRGISGYRWPLLAVSLLAVLAGVALLQIGWVHLAYIPLAVGLAMGFEILTSPIPVCTPSRARVLRYVKWIVYPGLLFLAFHPSEYNNGVFGFLVLNFVSEEWQRASIRRKLPVVNWPRNLYL